MANSIPGRNGKAPGWDIVKVFQSGNVLCEVSKSDTTPVRYSYRLSWKGEKKQGPWFPDRDISLLANIQIVVTDAESWILGERSPVRGKRSS